MSDRWKDSDHYYQKAMTRILMYICLADLTILAVDPDEIVRTRATMELQRRKDEDM